jgi:hypothetical protein
MSIDTIDHPWGGFGSLDTTLTDEKRDVGWVSGDNPDRPTVERFNLLQNETDTKLNVLTNNAPKTLNPAAGSLDVIRRLYTPEISTVSLEDDINILDASDTTKEYIDTTFTIIGVEKKLIAINKASGACEADIFDLATAVLDDTIDLSTKLPSGSGEDWVPISICNDGTSAYIVFQDLNSNNTRLQAYNIATWNHKAGWSATGVALTANATAIKLGSIICCTNSKLAIAQNWVNVTSGTSSGILIHDMDDGAQLGTGSGDTTITDGYITPFLTSDSTYVYFCVEDDSTYDVEVCSMSIASPGATGCGGSNWPSLQAYTSTGANRGILSSGTKIVSIYGEDPRVRVHSTSDAEVSDIDISSSEAAIIEGLSFDGNNFWCLAEKSSYAYAVRLDCVDLIGTISDGENYISLRDAADAAGPTMTFDGSDMWITLTAVGSTASSGKIIRFAKATLR